MVLKQFKKLATIKKSEGKKHRKPPLGGSDVVLSGRIQFVRRATTDRLGSAQTRVSTGAPRAAALAAAPAAARSCAPARPALGVTMRATQVLRMPAWYRGHRQEGTTY